MPKGRATLNWFLNVTLTENGRTATTTKMHRATL